MAYISREKALVELQKFSFDTSEAYGCGYSDCLTAVEDVLNDLPTADVVEVKHGKWIFVLETFNKRVFECSSCNYIRKLPYGEVIPDLCEKCGAKMDEGNEE